MIFCTDNIVKEASLKLVDKEVYFMVDKNIIRGRIHSFDKYQFFVDKKYGIKFNETNFFFSLDELFTWLKDNMIILNK